MFWHETAKHGTKNMSCPREGIQNRILYNITSNSSMKARENISLTLHKKKLNYNSTNFNSRTRLPFRPSLGRITRENFKISSNKDKSYILPVIWYAREQLLLSALAYANLQYFLFSLWYKVRLFISYIAGRHIAVKFRTIFEFQVGKRISNKIPQNAKD